ncbi:MAG: sodium-translocating pyrophosphatase [Planctomycetota bacterium]
MDIAIVWFGSMAASIAALSVAWRFYGEMMQADEGDDSMRDIAEKVRKGASAYLNQQNKVIAAVFVFVAILLAVAALGLGAMSVLVPIAFLTGGLFSGVAGWFGMKTATQASGRTAAAARTSLNDALQIAFRSGAVMGLTVVGLGLAYIGLWFAALYYIAPMINGQTWSPPQISVAMLSFGMGASAQALFARVGGGVFTKAADVGADLVGKVESSLAEDSPRNPATIADNVGDNVGDVAGMGADLYESYCGSILAASALGVAAMAGRFDSTEATEAAMLSAMMLPVAVAAIGIPMSIFGVYAVRTGDDLSQKALLHALDRGINRASLGVVVIIPVVAWWLMPSIPEATYLGFVPGVALSVIVGLVAGVLLGKWTERVTSDQYAPTQKLAEQAETGSATIIISGVADGMMSTWVPVILICLAMILSFGCANGFEFSDPSMFALGLYGVAVAAVGMLSPLGITLATDAYGPIADNAGGNAEMAGLEPVVRDRTDALDSLGNTTAATGKGFAIGSAALTALALLAAYIESVRDGFERWASTVAESLGPGEHEIAKGLKWISDDSGGQAMLMLPTRSVGGEAASTIDIPLSSATLADFLLFYDATLMNPKVLVGVFLGAMASFLFCALTMKSVGRAAKSMVEEVRRQFKNDPGIIEGTVEPDYERPIEISTREAQREMILPSAIGLGLPLATGLVLGVAGVLGLLAGCLTSGFCLAIFMANSGGSWDNAKKYIEAGHHGGKGSEPHKAAVVGDTVGDPFKDTSGPSLNILIKLMSMVSVVLAGLVVRYSLVALGWF